jgi:hypothetical protein
MQNGEKDKDVGPPVEIKRAFPHRVRPLYHCRRRASSANGRVQERRGAVRLDPDACVAVSQYETAHIGGGPIASNYQVRSPMPSAPGLSIWFINTAGTALPTCIRRQSTGWQPAPELASPALCACETLRGIGRRAYTRSGPGGLQNLSPSRAPIGAVDPVTDISRFTDFLAFLRDSGILWTGAPVLKTARPASASQASQGHVGMQLVVNLLDMGSHTEASGRMQST